MAKGKKQTEEKPNRKAKQNNYEVIVKPNLEKVKDWYRNGATEAEVAKIDKLRTEIDAIIEVIEG